MLTGRFLGTAGLQRSEPATPAIAADNVRTLRIGLTGFAVLVAAVAAIGISPVVLLFVIAARRQGRNPGNLGIDAARHSTRRDPERKGNS